jgi:branched-chain amino acid transport system substrate-binding protein
MKTLKVLLASALAASHVLPAAAQSGKPVKVALIADSTGPLEAYAKQTFTGFKLGLEYLTKGTMTVAGRKIELIEKDSQTKPDVGRNLLSEAFGDLDADLAVGGTSSAVALAMLPVVSMAISTSAAESRSTR